MPGGRPTKYKPEFCQKLIEHMSQGFTFESFGADVETGKETLYNWCKKYPEFFNARKVGNEKSRRFWEDLGTKGTKGLLPDFKAVAWIFTMKCRFRDTHNETLLPEGDLTINVNFEPESKRKGTGS